jgi:hypothetical protein
MSVTFMVDVRGAISFWLTKESGQLPLCEDPVDCGCGEETGVNVGTDVEPYVVILVSRVGDGCEEIYAVFSLLSRETLVICMEYVLYSFSVHTQLAAQCKFAFPVEAAMRELQDGMFSAMDGCVCGEGNGVCTGCGLVPERGRRFVCQTRYAGHNPLGEQHWWTGVTDAADEESGVAWLRCCRRGRLLSSRTRSCSV